VSSFLKNTIIILSFWIGIIVPVLASKYKVELLNDKRGIDSSVLFSIVQDQQGYLWFGSGYNGMFRYDGKNMVEFRHHAKQTNGLAHNNAGNLTFDQDNNLWIGSWGGSVSQYNLSSSEFTHHPHDPESIDSVSGQFVQKIFQDQQQDIWLGTFMNGLNKYNKNEHTFTRFPFNDATHKGTSHERIWDIAQTDEKGLWLGTGQGLNYYHKESGVFDYFLPDPASGIKGPNKIRRVLPIDNKKLLLATDAGVYIFYI
jgi:ligand-binding sensor domain-containing protein